MPLDIEKLKELSPVERIRKLKEIEEEKKEEIKEAEALIKEIQKGLQEEKIPAEVKIPEAPVVDISELFGPAPSTLERHAQEARTVEEPAVVMYTSGEGVLERVDYTMNIPSDEFFKMEDKLDIRRYSNISEDTAKLVTASLQIDDHIRKYIRG